MEDDDNPGRQPNVGGARQRPRQQHQPARGRGTSVPRMRGRHGPQHNHLNPRRVEENGLHNNVRQQNRDRTQWQMGFKTLETIVQDDPDEVIIKINQKKESFFNLLNSLDPTDEGSHNIIVLVMELLSKVCSSAFVQLKLTLLLDICNSRFIGHLSVYLMNLSFVTRKIRNARYWDNQEKFWQNFETFSECLINLSPSTALRKCKALIESISKHSIEGLVEKHELKLSEELNTKISLVREKLIIFEKEDEQIKKRRNDNDPVDEMEPPDDFRQLSLVPTRDDLVQGRPFLRANIVSGAYRDIEHYLDVQFRLLREDCFGPLRDGINQFIEDPKRRKFDNIRVYHGVKFVEPYVSKTKVGSVIQLDEKATKRLRKINWNYSKRFIFGSLLLFTKDNCKSFITATILDRDVKLLAQGKIPISIVNQSGHENIYNGDNYVMIESEVYFEPYYHVLKALQDRTFPEHFVMSEYIVNVKPDWQPPSFIELDTVFEIETTDSVKFIFNPLKEETWPNEQDLGLNKSQYDAFKLALTHEYTVIQGPPGTGKTFLGVKVAKALLKNEENFNKDNMKRGTCCMMLVICYTNHALDQFLESILKLTSSIVRIGGQSRNPAMEIININKLRRKSPNMDTNRLYFEQKNNLRDEVRRLQSAQEVLDRLNQGVIKYDSVLSEVEESQYLGEYYNTHMRHIKTDPLFHWLFEHMTYVDAQSNVEQIDRAEVPNPQQQNDPDMDDMRLRTEAILDDFDDDDSPLKTDNLINTSFSVKETEEKLKNLILLYKKTDAIETQLAYHNKIEIKNEIRILWSNLNYFREMSVHRTRTPRIRFTNMRDLSLIPPAERWAIYFRWVNIIVNRLNRRIKPLQDRVQAATDAYEEARMVVDMRLLRNVKVIGMTTSGAARLRKLVQALAPPIVIVEEAAEVLEQHIVTALTDSCRHLILIGDHQQLRPSAASMRLARHYNIEISLFERMIKNGIDSRRLSVQHRMRPEIAALISPHIYPDLENHVSVQHFPNIRGVTNNLFFMSHNYKEEEVEDSASRSNQLEGDLTLGLANYLMQQGYQPEDVTILAAYSGQMFYLRKQREKYLHLSKVKITVVDNYQGEESKIILLSLVRNNDNDKIGFLGTENRICVALSRAREGMFIFGNIEILKNNSEIWKKIAATLDSDGSLGSSLMLKCEIHPGQITTVSSPEDFSKVPEGGCLLKCNFNLPCGHACPLVCHGYDRAHITIKCYVNCERILCDLGHVCPLLCYEKCQPCMVMVEKTLPCTHKMKIKCHLEPDDPKVKCLTRVPVVLPHCKHETHKLCFVKIESVRCPIPCGYRVKCGHECRLNCHVIEDPDHEEYVCEKPCAKAKKGCTANLDGDRGDHQCWRKCHEECDYCTVEVVKKKSKCTHSVKVACNFDPDEIPCRKNCNRALECGHFCKKKCYEKCGDCMVKVKKTIPDCKHQVDIPCKETPTRTLCKQPCERTMPCGHRCRDRCDKPCDPKKCTEIMSKPFKSPCGHDVMIPCNLYNNPDISSMSAKLLEFCKEPCGEMLECEHVCGGTCGTCRQGRMHLPCSATCHATTICGHKCKEPCKQLCPPCDVPCEVKCRHSRCNNRCGQPCVLCKEPCERKCPHGECRNRCGEPCSRAACDEPCGLRLRCGHACRGLCGEPCPDICNVCRPDDFPKDFTGDDYEDTDRFVKLEDCGHIIEVENLDNLIKTTNEEIKIPACPWCRKPIINTYRYKDVINKIIKENINPIKKQVFGNQEKIKAERQKLVGKIALFQKDHANILLGNLVLNDTLQYLIKEIKKQKKISLLNLEMQSLYLSILDMIREKYQKFKENQLTKFEIEMQSLIGMLCKVLKSNLHKISQQMQQDIGNELKRMNSLIQLAQILGPRPENEPSVKRAADAAISAVLTFRRYQEEEALEALRALQTAVNMSGVVTREERALIVKAIGLKQGHWYKCPNGHFYCIGECGGAMERSRCPDCGATIGGANHALHAGNRHAGEIDGSPFAAWSQEYNNMANFDL